MKFIKRMLLRAILSQKEREVIVNSINYSIHRYLRRRNHEKAMEVSDVAASINPLISEEVTYCKAEVDFIVKSVRDDAFMEVSKLLAALTSIRKEGCTISRSKCEKCERKDSCPTYQVVFSEDKSETAEESQQAPAAEVLNHEPETPNNNAAGNEEQPADNGGCDGTAE